MDDRALDKYKLHLDYLMAQYDRLLTRFNYFLTIEVATFGFLGLVIRERGATDAVRLPALLGIAVSLLWLYIAYEDRRLVKGYRQRADQAAGHVCFKSTHPAERLTHGFKSNRVENAVEFFGVTGFPRFVAFILFVFWGWLYLSGPSMLEKLVCTEEDCLALNADSAAPDPASDDEAGSTAPSKDAAGD